MLSATLMTAPTSGWGGGHHSFLHNGIVTENPIQQPPGTVCHHMLGTRGGSCRSLGSGFKQAPANMPVFELLVKISNWCDTSHYLFTPITKLGRPQISFIPAMGQCPQPVSGQNHDGAGALRSQGHPGCLPLKIARTGGRKKLEGRDEKEKRCCFQKEYICARALILQ